MWPLISHLRTVSLCIITSNMVGGKICLFAVMCEIYIHACLLSSAYTVYSLTYYSPGLITDGLQ